MQTDPIADFLTRIRNAAAAKHQRVDVPVSRLKTEIARNATQCGRRRSGKTRFISRGLRSRGGLPRLDRRLRSRLLSLGFGLSRGRCRLCFGRWLLIFGSRCSTSPIHRKNDMANSDFVANFDIYPRNFSVRRRWDGCDRLLVLKFQHRLALLEDIALFDKQAYDRA